MYNLDIQSVTAQSAKAIAYGDLRMRSRAVKVLDTFFRFPIPTVSAFSNEAIHVTITDSAVLDQSGNNIEEQVNPSQVRALRNEMALRRSAAFRFAQPVMIVCGALLLILVIMRGAFGVASPEMVEQLALVQLLAGVCVLALGAAVLFMFGLSGSFLLVAFYGPRLVVTKRKEDGVSRYTFALLSSRVSVAEKEALQLPEDFRARLEKYIAPAKLVFAMPGASDGEKILYHKANDEATFSQYNFVSFPLYGAPPVGMIRINGEVSTLYLDQHPFDQSANWKFRDMRNADEKKYLAAVEAICRAIYENYPVFITKGVTSAGQMMNIYAENMRRIASTAAAILLLSFAMSAQNIAAVAALNGAASYVPDMGERVVYMFEKGNLPAVGNGVSTLPELLRDIPGFHDNENRGPINKVVAITKDNRRKDFPLQKAPESARPVVTSVAPAVDDGFMWGDSAANVRMYQDMKNRGRKAIIQAGSAGGIGGFLDVLLVILLPVWIVLVVIFLVIANTATDEITHFRKFQSAFVKASEITRFLIWLFLVIGFVISFAKYFFWTIEDWLQWYDFLGYGIWTWVGQSIISGLVKNPSFIQQSGGRDVISR